jgi:hypothetical protein
MHMQQALIALKYLIKTLKTRYNAHYKTFPLEITFKLSFFGEIILP